MKSKNKVSVIFGDIEFTEVVSEQINLFNEVLAELNAPLLFENTDFKISDDIYENYFSIETTKFDRKNVHLLFILDTNHLGVDIDRISESCEFSVQYLNERKEEVKEVIKVLLSGYVLIENCGNATFVNLFYGNGKFYGIWSFQSIFRMVTGSYLKTPNCIQQIYLPLYSQR